MTRPWREAARVQVEGSVGERSHAREAAAEASRGGMGSENAGMSNERGVRNSSTECLRVPE